VILIPQGPYGYTLEPKGDGRSYKLENIFGQKDTVYLDLVNVQPGIWKDPTSSWYEPEYYHESKIVGQQLDLF